ncbi:hypothetical protein OG264_10375 [Streptomyces xanthophaeus]|uniref:hypothetical protein n=1 Tax=Streptomyces xanthophaeus TaxID=67385 RepID=UPI00386FE3DB|nr:hypothetical protein OG264_10375 [Streptomyces xanthophaeus]WST63146.1 hypothetical protein OG605_27985 [Streptomyces xanthophaeus]
MTTEIEQAAAQVAKLRAQAEKAAGPLAAAEAALRSAEEAETTRRANRAAEYNRDFAATWRTRAESAADSGDEAKEAFLATLAAEPWFAAYVEYRAARYKRGHVLTEAQRAQSALGEVSTVPEQRWYGATLLEDIVTLVEKEAGKAAAEFAQELDDTREAFLTGRD